MYVLVVTAEHQLHSARLPHLVLRPVFAEGACGGGDTFAVTYLDEAGRAHPLGRTLIAGSDITIGSGLSTLNALSGGEALPAGCYSIGVDEQYYACIELLPQKVQKDILGSLRDLAFASEDGDDVVWPVDESSRVSRWADMQEPQRQATPYQFTFRARSESSNATSSLSFTVDPRSVLPTNVHVLIGRNGVGKTTILNHMVQALRSETKNFAYGVWIDTDLGPTFTPDDSAQFSTVVSMNFGSFDAERETASNSFAAASANGPQFCEVRHTEYAQEQFADAMQSTIASSRLGLWCNAISDLCVDPLLAELDLVGTVASHIDDPHLAVEALLATYRQLSAGHKSVLLGVTFLVHHAQPQTLVLLDEPETHLHPPLLSAYMRALCRIMQHRNAVCIIATHSPVVVAEVPSQCVHVVLRVNNQVLVKRPRIQTFGENVSVLTEEIFGLDVQDTGFHKVVADACSRFTDFAEAQDYLGESLGSEARAVLYATSASQQHREGSA